MIDEVRIYDRALTQADAEALFEAGRGNFSVGDIVETSFIVEVRETPGGTFLGTHPAATAGTVVEGPVTGGGFTWWRIDYESGADGWSIEDGLEPSGSTTYFPAPESGEGWRSLVTINADPSQAQKQEILDRTGIDWDALREAWEYSQWLSADSTLLVIRNGWVAGEWGGASRYHVASVTKSLTALVMARLLDQSDAGQLPKPIGLESLAGEFLPEAFTASDELKEGVRIKHLLTMSSGIAPADPDNLTMEERLAYPMDAAPESEWVYSSLPPNLLSMIVEGLTGQSLGDVFNSEIAAAIGAAPLTWQTIDGGFTRGAAGAHVSARDLARIAYLTLHDGKWGTSDGLKQVITAERIETITQWAPFLSGTTFRFSPGSPFPLPSDAPNHYGYLWWTNRTGVALGGSVPSDAYYMHGFRDNLAIVVPSLDLIVIRLAAGGPATDPAFRSQLMSLVMSALIF